MLKDGTYYSVTEERNNQMDDKTENGYAEIITLLSIGKELLYRAEKLYTDNQKAKPTKEEMQIKAYVTQAIIFTLLSAVLVVAVYIVYKAKLTKK